MVELAGMFGENATFFCNSPVVVTVRNLQWPNNTPFHIVHMTVLYDGNAVGDFRGETGGQTTISFDISSALRAIWADYDYSLEVAAANTAIEGQADTSAVQRSVRTYRLQVSTEYISDSDDEFEVSSELNVVGGRCILGGSTEMERYTGVIGTDVSTLSGVTPSTKPVSSSPERIGVNSISSGLAFITASGSANLGAQEQKYRRVGSTYEANILRDDVEYVDFLFVNRRGAVETCSGQTLEAMNINVETTQYARVGNPSFIPTRSLSALATGGRRSWSMSSGYQTREWADWWTLEFLKAPRWWMRYNDVYVPVTVEPGKNDTTIYDRTKQQMPSVEFTVTLALEG